MSKSLIILLLLVCCSFATDKTPEKCYRSFQQWYTGHHEQLLVQKAQRDLTFELRYLPNEITICQQILKEKTVSRKQLKSLYDTYGVYDQYSLKIESPGSSDFLVSQSVDKTDYKEKQFYLIESVQQDFFLVHNQDTLKPVHCTFENNYGTAPFITLHLAFEKAPKGKVEKWQLFYTDQLFEADTLLFDFTHLKNLEIPKIK